MNKYYESLHLLSELANEYGTNHYNVVDYAFGFIPYKNGKNVINEIGSDYVSIAKWLIDEGEKNFNIEFEKEDETMKSIEIARTKHHFSLIVLTNEELKTHEFAVVYDYNGNMPFGHQWAFGRYYQDLESALNHFRHTQGLPSIIRLEEICTQALHWIEDEYDDFEEFEENYELDFEEEELLFFGLDKYI